METPVPDAGKALPSEWEFAWKVHAYTNDYIRFADAKAGVVITWCASLVALLFAAKAHHNFMEGRFTSDFSVGQTALATGSVLAYILLAAAVACAFWCVKPRLWTWRGGVKQEKGLIYWGQVQQYPSPTAYAEALKQAQPTDLARAVAEHIYTVGGIAHAKFTWIGRSLIFGATGTLLAAIVVLFTS